MRYLLPVLAFLFLQGCVYPAQTLMYNPSVSYEPKPDTYLMKIMDSNQIEREYQVIGEVWDAKSTVHETHEGILELMREAARKMGGDAMIDLESVTRNESHDWIPHNVTRYKAKVIVFTDQS